MKQIACKNAALLPSGGVYDTTLPTGVPSTGNLLQLESVNTPKCWKKHQVYLNIGNSLKKPGP